MQKWHYWLIAREPDSGKPYCIYGGVTESEAREKGLEMLGGLDFTIKHLPTRNLNSASAMIRGVRLEESHSLKQAGRRIGHDKSLKRRSKRAHNKFIGDRYFIEQY